MLRMFIYYIKVCLLTLRMFTNKQNFAVPAASGDPYDVNVLLAVIN